MAGGLRWRRLATKGLRWGTLAVFAILLGFPFYWMLITSLVAISSSKLTS